MVLKYTGRLFSLSFPSSGDKLFQIRHSFQYKVFFVFSGYAGLFALQKQLKNIYNIADNNSSQDYLFGVAGK